MRRLVYYIATSIDGFIADPGGDFSHFPVQRETLDDLFRRYPETCPVHLREPLGVTAQPVRFDTVLMGRRTHAPAMDAGLEGGAYPHLRQIVVTRRPLPRSPGLRTMSGDVRAQVADLKNESGRDIWLCGGADLAGQLLDLIDEIQLKVNPILLGSGIPLFSGNVGHRTLREASSDRLPGGVRLTTYNLEG